eukprot:3557626-Amphidinium_carterae.3
MANSQLSATLAFKSQPSYGCAYDSAACNGALQLIVDEVHGTRADLVMALFSFSQSLAVTQG